MKLAPGAAIGAAALLVALEACGSATSRIPRGFYPESIAAASAHDVWLLGVYRCGSSWCNAIVRTSDGGRSFVRVSVPPLPNQGDVPELRFADRRNGYVFVGSLTYATHDGGATWRRVQLGPVFSMTTGGGRAYALILHGGLHSSSVSGDTWRRTALGFVPTTVAVLGEQVWVLGWAGSKEKLGRSANGGRTFVTGRGPCYPNLGGQITPASAAVLWAVCPTGMDAGASMSADGGKSFHDVMTPYGLINAAAIAPAGPRTAVLIPGVASRPLVRTTNGGAHWTRPRTPGRAGSVFAIGFVDARTGFALAQVDAARQVLWKTTDAGATWRAVPIR